MSHNYSTSNYVTRPTWPGYLALVIALIAAALIAGVVDEILSTGMLLLTGVFDSLTLPEARR